MKDPDSVYGGHQLIFVKLYMFQGVQHGSHARLIVHNHLAFWWWDGQTRSSYDQVNLLARGKHQTSLCEALHEFGRGGRQREIKDRDGDAQRERKKEGG